MIIILKKLRFHSRLIAAYTLSIIIILITVSMVFVSYTRQLIMENARTESLQTAVAMRDKLGYTQREMRSVVGHIRGQPEIVLQLRTLSETENKNNDNRFADALWMKRLLLNAIGTTSEIYRLSVFTDKGDFVSTSSHIYEGVQLKDMIVTAQWYEALTDGLQDEYLCFPHKDNWADDRFTMVYSLVVPIRYYDELVGFAEVQLRMDEYDQAVFDLNLDRHPTRMIVSMDNRLFYSNRASYGGFLTQHYLEADEALISGATHAVNPVTQKDEMIVILPAGNGWNIIVAQELDQIMKDLNVFPLTFAIVAIVILLISVAVNYILINRLTIPLRKLKQNIDSMQADTLTQTQVKLSAGKNSNELTLIQESFNDMQARLKQSMDNEIRLQYLQTKAHFDTLQARINPHYLYNTLGVVSSMCSEVGQDEIAGMCVRLSRILRYSMASADAITTVSEEINHARDYLDLMKKRFEHRLEYTFSIDPGMNDALIPKLCVQPLIENSILHGFETVPVEIMRIDVQGLIPDGNYWEITIRDNGCGFSPEALSRIRTTIEEYKKRMRKVEESSDLSIGGMGIVNTFVRIELFSSRKVEFTLANTPDGGAAITIRCPIIKRTRE